MESETLINMLHIKKPIIKQKVSLLRNTSMLDKKLSKRTKKRRPLPYWPETALDAIEANADQILREIGVANDHAASLEQLAATPGCRVDGGRVYPDGAELRKIIRATTPSSFIQHARNTARTVHVGAEHAPVFVPSYGSPKVLRADGVSRLGEWRDYRDLVTLAQAQAAIQCSGTMLCMIHDQPEAITPLLMAEAHLSLSDKPMMGSIASPQALREVAEMAAIAAGGCDLQQHCLLVHLINSTPPLGFQQNPLACLQTAAQLGQANMVTSYIMMGATGPVTAAGVAIMRIIASIRSST